MVTREGPPRRIGHVHDIRKPLGLNCRRPVAPGKRKHTLLFLAHAVEGAQHTGARRGQYRLNHVHGVLRCASLENDLQTKVARLIAEGEKLAQAFDRSVRQKNWHPFVAADYNVVLRELLRLRRPGATFLECGSATGVVAIMADLLGFDACGIESDASLVAIARQLASEYGSDARFAHGSFLPDGYQYRDARGDPRLGTLTEAPSGFPQLGRSLADFEFVFAYPWAGEASLIKDLMERHGGANSQLLLYGATGEKRITATPARHGGGITTPHQKDPL